VVVALKTVKEGDSPTVGIINRDVLFSGHGVILVNLANRTLVDEEALAQAILTKKVAAYSLDRNSDSLEGPLKGLDEVHFAPSNAWNSDESMDTLRATWASNVIGFINGKPMNQYQH
jgi:lactate dehydrogenase-like 2-hydroxyacid dehydrogenase